VAHRTADASVENFPLGHERLGLDYDTLGTQSPTYLLFDSGSGQPARGPCTATRRFIHGHGRFRLRSGQYSYHMYR